MDDEEEYLDDEPLTVEELVYRALLEAAREALDELDLASILRDGAREGALEALEGTAMMLTVKPKNAN